MIPFDRGAVNYARETLSATVGAAVSLSPTLLDNINNLPANPPPHGGVNTNWRRATLVRIAVNSNAIRFTLSGVTPTSAIGEELAATEAKPYLQLPYQLAKEFQAIGIGGTADLEVTYFN